MKNKTAFRLGLLGASLALLVGAASASAEFTEVPYTAQNEEKAFSVPVGIHLVAIDAIGQSGFDETPGSTGTVGRGGNVSAKMEVSPGETLFAWVGANEAEEGEGGGASEVRTVSRSEAGSLASRILVAGGGGNPGLPGAESALAGGAGGDAESAGTGGGGAGGGGGGTGGGAGTPSGPGAGGPGGSTPATSCSLPANGPGGEAGNGVKGGLGGEYGGNCADTTSEEYDEGGVGGAGGDGYFGGGGGGSGGGSPRTAPRLGGGGGGGGGGGSNYVAPALLEPAFNLASLSDAPEIVFSYSQPDVTVESPAEGATYTVGQPVTADYECTEGGAAIAECEAAVEDGEPIDTSTPGVKTFTVTALDTNGNERVTFVEYAVEPATTATAIGASPNPAAFGQAVTITAHVTGQAPTGAVTFTDGGTAIGTSPIGAGGNASITTSTLAVGSHLLRAAYGGDASNASSLSPVVVESVSSPTSTPLLMPTPQPVGAPQPPSPAVTVSYDPNHPHRPDRKGGPRYTFYFEDQAPGTTFYCRLDKDKFDLCTSPTVYRDLKRGRHTFAVKSVTALGVESATQVVKFFAGKRRRPSS